MTDQKRIEQLKKAPPIRIVDIIVIVALAILAIVLSVTGAFDGKKGNVLLLTVDGKATEYRLDENREIFVKGLTVEIKDGCAYVKESDCDDKVCVHQGKISRVNESIVCLPQGISLKISGKSDFDASTGQEE